MFDYTIKADGSQAVAESVKVETSLEGLEAAATSAGESVQRTFKAAGAVLRDSEGRFLGTSVAVQQLRDRVASATSMSEAFTARMKAGTAALNDNKAGAWGLSKAFEQLTAGLKRENEMLEAVRGPSRRHAEDLALLESMYKRGAISAREYANQVAKTGAAPGSAGAGGGGVGGGVLQGAGLGALAGGAAGIAAAATSKILELGGAVLELGEAYNSLDNRLKRLKPVEEERVALMNRTFEIANESRSDVTATGESFVRLTNATKSMGLTQERVLNLTGTISKAFSMSGASASEASAGMLQLSQAFASGRLQGDEFRSSAEAVPDVLDLIAKQMGVNRGELKELSSEGKITADVLVAAFENAKENIDAGFAKTTPSLSQSFAVFKNEMIQVFGPLLQQLLPAVAEKMKEVAELVKTIVDGVITAKNAVGTVGNIGKDEIGISAGDVFGHLNSAFNPYKQFKKLKSFDESEREENTANALAIGKMVDAIRDAAEAGSHWTTVLIQQAQQVANNNAAIPVFIQNVNKLASQWEEAETKGAELGRTIKGVVEMSDPWADKGSAAAQKVKGEVDKLIGSFDGLRGMVADGLGVFSDLADRSLLQQGSDALTGWIADQVEAAKGAKMWNDTLNESVKGVNALAEMLKAIKGPQLEFNRNMAALDTLLKTGRITLLEYNTQLVKVIDAFRGAGSSDWRLLDATKPNQTWVELQSTLKGVGDELARVVQQAKEFDDASIASRQEWFAPNLEKDLADFDKRQARDFETSLGNGGGTQRTNKTFVATSMQEATIYTKAWNEELERSKKKFEELDTLTKATLGAFENALVDSALKGKLAFGDFFKFMQRELTKLAVHKLITGIVGMVGGGGGTASIFGTGATQAFEGKYSPPGYARGGSYTVGGAGGPDSQNVMFRLSPGERVDFTPKGDQPSNGGGPTVIQNNYDPRALMQVFRTRSGKREILNVMADHRAAIRAVLR